MGDIELQIIIEGYEKGNHVLLAAADLTEYARKYGDGIKKDEKALKFCRYLAYEFIKKKMFDSARSLYHTFGMNLEEINTLIIKEARRELGVEERLIILKQKDI